MIDAADALQRLRDGNRRFVDGSAGSRPQTHRPELADGQSPFAIVLSCSDSRVPVEFVFDQSFGDLFVIRVAGNIVAPSQIGSVEYAASVLGCELVVVLGHSGCGAVAAAWHEIHDDATNRSPNLRAIVDRIRPAIGDSASPDAAIRDNVRKSVERLRHGSLLLERILDDGRLMIVGAEYSLDTGEVVFLDDDNRD